MPPRFLTFEEVRNIALGGDRGYISLTPPPTSYPSSGTVPVQGSGPGYENMGPGGGYPPPPPGYFPATNVPGSPGGTYPGFTPSLPGLPQTSGNGGGPLEAIANAGCDLIPNVALRALCKAGVPYLPGGTQPGQPTTSSTPMANTPTRCPPGYEPDGQGGCRVLGMGTYLPGDIGQQDTGWTLVNGHYGAGRTPILVQRNVRACPPGWKLGKDGVCYEHLTRARRLHDPGTKPVFTGGDMNAFRKVKSLQKTVSKMNRLYGKKTKAQLCAKPTRRK